MTNDLIVALSVLLLLTGCLDTEIKQEIKPEPKAWWESYSLECDAKGRAAQINQCVKLFYAHNPNENPELEAEALERCRLSSSMMFCAWRKP